jgi:hypothetical protein
MYLRIQERYPLQASCQVLSIRTITSVNQRLPKSSVNTTEESYSRTGQYDPFQVILSLLLPDDLPGAFG